MKINKLVFWRTSFAMWIGVLAFVVAMQVTGHPYPRPMLVFLPPIVFAAISAFQLRREMKNVGGKKLR